MESRRNFLKKAAMLAAGGGLAGSLPASIQRALAIDPPKGTSFLDAEHVVILMQENRSFDHCYGTLRGVRGFDDPRAVTLPNGNPVWLQTNAAGETYAPFRLNIKDTRATWMSSLPHSWSDQVDARNGGKHDGWLEAKRSGNSAYAKLPLTLGFYNRDDLPFYYALADAFTICDQTFCSSLTGTTPNRLYLWTGTIRERPTIRAKANVRNSDVEYDSEASWTTFPERLEEKGISWRIYQNELSLQTGLQGEAAAWLANFTDNPLEWFRQYNVRFARSHQRHLEAVKDRARSQWTEEKFARLPAREQQLHRRAFTTNEGDPNYRQLATLSYKDNGATREMRVPKGDVLHQFRQDVRNGQLPAVSWVVAPQSFSDHPGSPWFGAWYVSEVLDILTSNPEVWKKTIFILCYDENDGYFDHVPPFVPPDLSLPGSGKASPGIDTAVEQVSWDQERASGGDGRAGPIGLGYRVPLVIASPWSRGGYVCSQVFDHTSILQFLELLLSQKSGAAIRESNISSWRRAVCGDLTSVFRPYNGEKLEAPTPVNWETFAGTIQQARLKPPPSGFKRFTSEEIAQAQKDPRSVEGLPRQEPGGRPSCALPYELSVDGSVDSERKSLTLEFAAGKERFGQRAAGAPFHVYAPGPVRVTTGGRTGAETGRTWAYAVAAGDRLRDTWQLRDFEGGRYHLRVHGPNGFYREFRGTESDPLIDVSLRPASPVDGNGLGAVLQIANRDAKAAVTVLIAASVYGGESQTITLAPAGRPGATADIPCKLDESFGWYDFVVRAQGDDQFSRRYAGRIETGKDSMTDPQIGRA